jgi:hypothetical protein
MIKSDNFYMLCDECPICEDMERRLHSAKEYEFKPQIEYCSCDKIGMYFYVGGYCEDAWIERSVHKNKNPRKTGRAYRRKMKIRKEDRLYHIVKGHYMPHVGWVDWEFNGRTLHGSPYYFKDSSHSRKQKWLKKQTIRKVRRMDIANGNYYRKCYEYWWNMY